MSLTEYIYTNCQINEIDKTSINLNEWTLITNIMFYNGDFQFEPIDILFFDNKIVATSKEFYFDIPNIVVNKFDGEAYYLTPALVEQHIHGAYGINFNTANETEIEALLVEIAQNGIGFIVPTITTDSIENIKKQINIINNVIDKQKKTPQKVCCELLGIHLEGPFLNNKCCGIQPKELILEPLEEYYQELDTTNIKIITYAPEKDFNNSFIRFLNKNNIIPAAGHFFTTANNLRLFIQQGGKQITHLFNGQMPKIHHRDANATLEALINDNIYTEVIADLEHLIPEMLSLVIKSKPKDKIIFISDALPLSHFYNDYLNFAGTKIIKNGYKAIGKDGTIAGSIQLLGDIYSRLKEKISLKFEDFIQFSSINPATNLGIPKEKYSIKVGYSPKLCLWDKKNYKVELIS